MDLRETLWHGMDWIHLAQDKDQLQAVVNYGNEPLCFIQGEKFLKVSE
jgi:hypothetical protein